MNDRTTRRRVLGGALVTSAGLIGAARAQAQWPTKPVRILISFPPGGSSDFVARVLTPYLSEQLGQQFIVDNRPGAGGTVAADILKKEAPDGYNFMISNNAPFTIAPTQFKKIPYDPLRDFTHITYLGSTFGGLLAHPKIGVKTLPELVAKAKAEPGKFTYGSSGVGSIGHISGETFRRLSGIDILHIPYKGAGPLRLDFAAGVVDMQFEGIVSNLPAIRAGALVALAAASAERLPPAPDVPTFREQGFDMTMENWHGMTAPARLPSVIADRFHQVLIELLERKEVLDKLATYGVFYKAMTGPAFAAYVGQQIEVWKPQIIAAGVAGQ